MDTGARNGQLIIIIIIKKKIMYIYHALINALSAHMIHINLNTLYTSKAPTITIYIRYYMETHKHTHTTHTHTHTHTH